MSLGAGGLSATFGAVAFGSVIPVVPTGAVVGAAAALQRTHPVAITLVLVVGAAGAYVGDLITYAALRRAGTPLAVRMGWLREDDPDSALARLRVGFERREVRSLVLARLVPAGRIPVLVVASLSGYPWRRFASATVLSVLAWSAMYTAIGLAGQALIPDPTVAVLVVVAVATLVTVLMQLVNRAVRARPATRARRTPPRR